MGGFEGGDEGGYWDIDTLFSTCSKTNKKNETFIELKDSVYSIRAHAKAIDDKYFIRNDTLYDIISFVPCSCKAITIEGCEDIPLKENTIFQAYEALNAYIADPDVIEFFTKHKVVVTKKIPLDEGLGGSLSNAAAFLRLLKEACSLVLSTEELVHIGSEFGDDFAFFIHNYACAYLNELGEITACFEEEL